VVIRKEEIFVAFMALNNRFILSDAKGDVKVQVHAFSLR
jgi:hypothetical protein